MRKSVALLLVLIFLTASCVIDASPALSIADFTEDAWVSKTPMRQARMRLGVAVVNGKIYAIGGDNLRLTGNALSADWLYGDVLSTNEEYDPLRDTWTFKEPMPTPRTHFGTAVYQNKIYCIGGYSSDGETSVNEVYDPRTNSWEIKASMPTSRTRVSANVVNGKIYVISNGANEVYDPATNTWATREPPPFKFYSTGSAVVGNKIYFIGGVGSMPVTNFRIRIYDTSDDSWSYGALSPTYGASACAGAMTGANTTTRIYFFDESSTHVYDPVNDSWTNGTRMQHSRGFVGVAVLDNTFYVVGGIFAPFEGYIVITGSADSNEQYVPSGYSGSVDIIRPNIVVVSPQNTTYFTTEIMLNFVTDESLSWARYSFNAQEIVEVKGNTTLTNLSYGNHNITVYGTDNYGNTGSSETIYFTIAKPEPFPTTLVVASIGAVAVAIVGLLVYFKKRRR
jgi:hypothetical protein